MERLGKGLLWNAATPTPPPVVFIPIPLASPLPVGELPSPTPNPLPNPAWPEASSATTSWSDSELIGSQVFRFEYYYLLKDGSDSDIPWVDPHTSPSGMQDVAAIVVDIAVIDPKSRALLGATDLAAARTFRHSAVRTLYLPLSAYPMITLHCSLSERPIGCWWRTLDVNASLSCPAISGIRLYER